MPQERYRHLELSTVEDEEEEEGEMISLTPSRRTISVASEADVMEGGMMASGGALAAGVRVGSRILGDPSAQQVTFRAPAARDTGKRIQYYPLVNVTQASMNIVSNIAYKNFTQELVTLRAYVTDGPMPCRVAGFILGCILFFRCASLLVVTLLLATDLWPPALMHHLLCSLLGLSTMLLEARPLLCTAHARKKTREYLKLFSFLWGRGVLNLIIAALLVLRYPEVTDLSLAGAFAALAAIDVVVGVASQRRLQALRETLTEDEKLLKDKFEAHRDASGKVQAKELAAICTELGSRLSHDELEHAILTVDTTRSGFLDYETFVDWWRSR